MLYKICIVYLAIFSLAQNVVLAQAPQIPLEKRPIPEMVSYYANEYAVPATTLLRVMKCESSGNQKAIGDNGKAHGIFQFHKPTWDRFTKEMGETLDRESAHDQAKVAAYAFSKGYSNHWSCK